VDRCIARWHQQVTPLRTAESAIGQWRTHVTAMNELVSGKISLSQAMKFWNQTRVGAKHHIEAFERTASRFHHNAAECSSKAAGQDSADSESLRRCTHAVSVGDRLLAIAEETIHTWKHHVKDMEMLRDGQMTSAQAAQMWTASWQAGNRQLHLYGAASRRAVYVRCP